jgi:hypothetical protein
MRGLRTAMAVGILATLAVACLAQEGGGRAQRSAAADSGRSPAYDSGFWEHWGDGRAELAGYDLTTPRYGAERKGTAVAIFVTEPFSDRERVKAEEAGEGTFQVMKLNLVQDFRTGIYDYNLMTSAFVALEPIGGESGEPGLPAGAPVKVSFSSQEWCGHVYQQALFRQSGVRSSLHSYFGGEADAESTLPARPAGVSEDALLLWARGLAYPAVAAGESVTVPLFTGLERSRLVHVEAGWETAELSRGSGTRELIVPAGTFTVEEARAVIRGSGGPDGERSWTFHVEASPPHRIVAWEGSDGERAELRGSDRLAYWKLNGPGGEEHLEALGLTPRPEGMP